MTLALKTSARVSTASKSVALAPLVDGTTATLPLTSPMVANGNGSLTFARNSIANVTDWEGLEKEVLSGEIRVEGGRRVENLASGYATQSITVISGNKYQVTIDGTSGDTCVATGAFTGTLTATGTSRISWNSGTAKTASTTTLTLTVTGALTKLLVEDVTGQSNTGPSENIDSSVDCGYGVNGVNNYLHQNGTAVNASGVVTEARGADLTGIIGSRLEGGATNIALQNRDFTQAVWAKTNITAAKDATGIGKVPNSASTLTATGANGTCFQTITAASAERNNSYYVKRKTGTGTIEITDNGGTNYTAITINSSTFTRVDITRTQANPVIGFRIVTSGDEIEVDYSQSETGKSPTSPIETGAGTASRTADVLSYPDTGNFTDGEGSVYMEFTPDYDTADVPSGTVYLLTAGGTNGRLFYIAGSAKISSYDGTTVINDATNLVRGTKMKAVEAWGGGTQLMCVDGSTTTGSYDGSWSPTSIYIGSNGSNQCNGIYSIIKFFPRKLTQTEAEAMTS